MCQQGIQGCENLSLANITALNGQYRLAVDLGGYIYRHRAVCQQGIQECGNLSLTDVTGQGWQYQPVSYTMVLGQYQTPSNFIFIDFLMEGT